MMCITCHISLCRKVFEWKLEMYDSYVLLPMYTKRYFSFFKVNDYNYLQLRSFVKSTKLEGTKKLLKS